MARRSADFLEGRARRRGVAVASLAAEAVADRVADRVQRDGLGERGETTQQRGVRQRPPEVLAGDRGRGDGTRPLRAQPADELAKAELGEVLGAVDQQVAAPGRARRRDRPGAAGSGPERSRRRARRSARAGGSSGHRCGRTRSTGAPVRSEPKVGNACAWRPSSKAATESISAAVTTPWPPRPWILTANNRALPLLEDFLGRLLAARLAVLRVDYRGRSGATAVRHGRRRVRLRGWTRTGW